MFAIASAIALLATPLAAQEGGSLPGVSDEETRITSGSVESVVRSTDSLLFVRDRANRWYRVQLNDNCLRPVPQMETLLFDNAGSGPIDKFTSVRAQQTGISCRIVSIRRSEAPPQVDSKSRVPAN
ncbi:hypothetical protein FHS61_001623 [Altererythrobacter atlanticus]|uniref:Uncharacterized protein n=1 Tax=Croceibacterium atlanticum TaxID=1267766 RepID=A0A0F7KNF5_9SPHN|nr:hypothetical protein [Croceibacterium atlanticum]AKH41099.1 hypothetical protein WYH_00032 [Croceibacterium atlanticum]MBB5732614.1 hypothetical protein [Croceibacterium atlanticum]